MIYYTKEQIEKKITKLNNKEGNSLGDALKLSFWKDQFKKLNNV